jgi:glycosyltransferase involved in cell wall biosynthesis
MSGQIAVGTKVFKRTKKLRNLLESVPNYVETVYVADDGKTDEREALYNREYDFELIVIDLEYDEGLGAGRRAIVQELTEEYLTIVDTDHVVPQNIDILSDILSDEKSLGGIAGAIIEPEIPVYYITGQNFKEKDGKLYRGPGIGSSEFQIIESVPIIKFDFLPNAAMFRRECLEEYCWDSEYTIGYEHADFYIGHWKMTDYEFAVCPQVIFQHYPGGSKSYEIDRYNSEKLKYSERYFLNKWEYSDEVTKGFRWAEGPSNNRLYFHNDMALWEKALGILAFRGPKQLGKELYSRFREEFKMKTDS